MTAPLLQQTVSIKDAAAIRKRRRRAPTGGAADDCFTCSRRNVKCDRRRPYCSQCLEIGNECSGYKTQLTWGIGVASRGKLRGLSLPVAKSPPVSQEVKKSPAARGRARSTVAVMAAHWAEQEGLGGRCAPIDIPSTSNRALDPFPGHSHHYFSTRQPGPASSVCQHGWDGLNYASGLVHPPDAMPRYSRNALPLIVDGLSSSVDAISEIDFLSHVGHAYSTRDNMSMSGGSSITYDGYPRTQRPVTEQGPPPLLIFDQARVAAACHGFAYAASEQNSSLGSQMDSLDAHLRHRSTQPCDGPSEHPLTPCPAYQF